MIERIVIVGAGQGGYQAAASLRQEGFGGKITLIGDEPGLPYQRPPLSKAYMTDGRQDRLCLKPLSFYERAEIEFHGGTHAVRIDRDLRSVECESGGGFPYDHLILATGAHNLRPPISGLDAAGVLELRTLVDAVRLREALANGKHAVVIGGGFIGLEFAAMARAAGVAVTVVEAAPRLMARTVSPITSDWFLTMHRAMGTEVLLGSLATGVERTADDGTTHVHFADGGAAAGDLVLLAAGVRPNTELATEAGLRIENGIFVDERLVTSDRAISALGDCASFPLPDGRRVRLESVQAAVDHARHIARRISKRDTSAYGAVPWFWSDQGKARLQIAGVCTNADKYESVSQPDGGILVLAFRDGCLRAAETVNAAGQHIAARKLLGVPYEILAETGFDLKAATKSIAA